MVDNNKSLGLIIVGFILIIIGIVLADVLADQISESTDLSTATGENMTVTASSNTAANESFIYSVNTNTTSNTALTGVSFFGNATNNTDSTNINLSINVNFTRFGVIIIDPSVLAASVEYNITYTFENNTRGTTDNADVTEITFFGNGSINSSAGITIGTDVNVTKATGVVSLDSDNFSATTYVIDYTYEGDLYVVDAVSRTLVDLIPIFFILGGAFAAGIGLVLNSFLREFMKK